MLIETSRPPRYLPASLVAHHAVHLTPQQLERAQIVPHPAVNPTQRAALPANPTAAPPVRMRQSIASSRSAGVNRAAPNMPSVAGPGTPVPNNRTQSVPNRMLERGSPTAPPPGLINRTRHRLLKCRLQSSGVPCTNIPVARSNHNSLTTSARGGLSVQCWIGSFLRTWHRLQFGRPLRPHPDR